MSTDHLNTPHVILYGKTAAGVLVPLKVTAAGALKAS